MNLRAQKLQLKNFRCFRDVTLDFHERLTVIVADNGMGKTALLDAVAIGMAEYVDAVVGQRVSRGILSSDVRTAVDGNEPTTLDIMADFAGKPAHWTLTRKSSKAPMRRGTSQRAAVNVVSGTFGEMAKKSDSVLPLFVFYQSSRFAHSSYFGEKFNGMKHPPSGRLAGFADYMTPLSDASRFNDWYSVRWQAVAKRAAPGVGSGPDSLAQLAAVRSAVATVLAPTGWSVIDWDDERRCVIVEHASRGRLPLSWLSSGIRSMVALVADLAFRCACLNPHQRQDAAVGTPGLVLIDEVDLHLHPSWQQRVVELLQAAFGSMQFVITTHSPQVLSTVHSDSVRIVKHGDDQSFLVRPTYQTRGVESADVLAEIMGVDPVPHVNEADALHRFRAFIEDGQTERPEIAPLRRRLLEHFGEQHPVMLDCARLERFIAFRSRRKQEGGSDAQA